MKAQFLLPTSTLLLLTTLTHLTTAQFRCQMFVNRPEQSIFASKPDIGEIRQNCTGVSSDPDITEPSDCITMGTFDVEFGKDIIVSKGATGLPEDILIHIFNSQLREGFLKYRTQDLNFETVNLCKITEDGSLDFNVQQVQCDFDCP